MSSRSSAGSALGWCRGLIDATLRRHCRCPDGFAAMLTRDQVDLLLALALGNRFGPLTYCIEPAATSRWLIRSHHNLHVLDLASGPSSEA